MSTVNPKIRSLDYQPVTHRGQQMWYLHDPLGLTTYQLVMPPALAQILLFLDGNYTPEQIRIELGKHFGAEISQEIIVDALAQLDEACLLDNERFRQQLDKTLTAYRSLPFRPAALAKHSYPASAVRLEALFASYGRGDSLQQWQPWHGRGLISPHIDYARGGPVYAKVWHRAQTAVLEADLVIILGTDHQSGSPITLTRQHFATPYGLLPTDFDLVDALADAIGPENAYASELHHRQEHSIELSAVWLHHLYHQAEMEPKPILPVLVGSFYRFMASGQHPADDPLLNQFLETLKRETAGKKVLVVASVDFAHVGPAFGDDFAMDEARRAALQQADAYLMQAIVRGDAESFYQQITAVNDQNRICGFAPIYLLLRYLESTEGIQVAYDQCSADAEDASLVSIAGVLLE